MAQTFKHPISTTANISGTTVYTPVSTGSYFLRKDPFTSNTYTGILSANGLWDFGSVEDGLYELWTASSKVDGFGRRYLCDTTPTFISIDVTGNTSLIGDLSVSGQVNFYNSFNLNGADLAHADNIQVNTFSENVGGQGIGFSHKLVLNDTIRTDSKLASITANQTFSGVNTFSNVLNYFSGGAPPQFTGSGSPSTSGLIPRYYADVNYGRINNGNTWTAGNLFNNYPTYNGNTSTVPTTYQFITKKVCEDLILAATLGSFTSTLVNQVSVNVVRLLPNGVNSTTNQVATSWSNAMVQAKNSITASPSSATKQMIVNVEGIGESGTSILITNAGIGAYFYPKVHTKGISQSVKLYLPDDSMDSGGSATNCIVENLSLIHDDGGLGATPNFANMTFKDCYFDIKADSLSFSNCMFRGSTTINLRTGTLYLNSISGTQFTSSVTAVETGVIPSYIVSPYL